MKLLAAFMFVVLVSEATSLLTAMDSCLLRIVHKYFTHGQLLLVGSTSRVADRVVSALQGAALWQMVSSGDRKLRNTSPYQQHIANYVVIITSIDNSHSQIDSVAHHPSWNSRAKFIIAVTDNASSDTAMERIFSQLWKRKVANVILLLQTLDIYSWQPYTSSSNCGGGVQGIVRTGQCLDQSDFNLFPDKNPKNLHGCMVDVGTFTWLPYVFEPVNVSAEELNHTGNHSSKRYVKGIEVNLFDAISRAANFRVNYKAITQPEWAALAKDVINGTVEVAFAAYPPHLDMSPQTDATVPYMRLTLCWFVPTERPIAQWKSLVRVFQPRFWLLVVLSYVLASATQWVLGSQTRSAERRMYREPQTSLMTTLSVVLGVSVTQPRTHLVRMFFFIWVFYSLQVNTAYQSMLIVVLSRVGYEPPILTIRDLLDSKLKLQVTPRVLDLLNDMNEGQYTEVIQRHVLCTDYEQCLNRLAFLGDRAFVTVKAYGDFLRETTYIRDGKALMKPLPSDVFVTYVRMILTKGSLLLDRFNTVIRRVVEGGMLVKWWADLKDTAAAEHRKKERLEGEVEEEDGRAVVLTPQHLQSAFYLLFIGVSAAAVALFAEIVWHRHEHRK